MSRSPRRAKRTVMSVAQYRQGAREHNLQAGLIQYLKLHARTDVHYFAIPNAAKRSWRDAAKMKAEGLRAGVADLCFMMSGGRVAWLELKIDNEKQTAEQVMFETICNVLGHPYMVARTFDTAVAILRSWRILKEIK